MSDTVGQLWQALDGLGYKETASRRQVLEAIAGLNGGFTAEELHAALPHVGRATVYRTVKLLVDANLLCRTPLEDGSPRYTLGPHAHHHHLVCVSCGAVRDFALCNLDDIAQSVERTTGYRVLSHQVEMYGVCASCRSGAAIQGPRS